MFRAARSILETQQLDAGYKHIIVDEIQDFHPQAFRLLRAMVPPEHFTENDLFLVGDGHQNIYGHHIVLGQLGINIRGRGRRLRLNYRTPEETRRWACSILTGIEIGDMDGSVDNDKGYRSIISGPEPLFHSASSFEDEVATIYDWIQGIRAGNQNQVICVASRTNKGRDTYAQALEKSGLKVFKITTDQHDIDDPLPIRVATMHRIKGLEFDHVCLADFNKTKTAAMSDSQLEQEKILLHVAATRTKNSLLVMSSDDALK